MSRQTRHRVVVGPARRGSAADVQLGAGCCDGVAARGRRQRLQSAGTSARG